jgi:hypothetical protein
MKKIKKYLSLFLFIPLLLALNVNDNPVVIQQIALDGNNINAWFFNTGIFYQDLRVADHPGFEWPKDSGKYAVFTAGLSIGAFVNNQLREAMCSYKGELAPGYIKNSGGVPNAMTDSRFRIYKINKNDVNNIDWFNWQSMIRFGAPFIDYNHNGIYEPFIDTPGVRGASQTLFVCLTDGFPEEHKLGEGFGGGTPPLFAEYHITAWCYDKPGLQDIQFVKWVIINKNIYAWDSTFFGITCDPDLGFANDDYIGCDTVRRLGYCYNGDNDDAGNSYSYGFNPPAVGFRFIRSAKNNLGNYLGMTSFTTFMGTSIPGPTCEKDPNGEMLPAYYLLKGIKKDRSPWVVPPGGPNKRTKFIYSGDPETGQGWNEGIPGNPSGCVQNCGGDWGNVVPVNSIGDRRLILTTGSNTLKVYPNDSQTIVTAQVIARGNSNLNSVTKLKQLSDIAQTFYDSGYVIGVNNISTEIPQQYKLYQNYPNPFNPTTNIKFEIPNSPLEGRRSGLSEGKGDVKLVIYDIQGKSVETLIDKELKAGSYSADWNASNYASGVYFYLLLIDGKIIDTKKMILIN